MKANAIKCKPENDNKTKSNVGVNKKPKDRKQLLIDLHFMVCKTFAAYSNLTNNYRRWEFFGEANYLPMQSLLFNP